MEKALQALHAAKEVPQVMDMYKELSSELQRGLETFHGRFHAKIQSKEAFSKGVEVYKCLQGMLDTGLKDHVCSPFSVPDVIENLQRSEEQANQYLASCIYTTDYIGHLRDLFRNNAPGITSVGWSYLTGSKAYSSEYRHLSGVVQQEVQACMRIIRSHLESANYQSVGVHALAIASVKKHLGEFLPHHVSQDIDGMMYTLQNSFNVIVNAVADASSSAGADLALVVRRFILYFHHVGKVEAVRDDLLRGCTRVHKRLLELSQCKVAAFEQSSAKFDVEHMLGLLDELRMLADLMASSLSTHLEDLRHGGSGSVSAAALELEKLQRSRFGGRSLSDLGKHFHVLQLTVSNTPDDVRRNYKRLSLEFHPDKASRKYGAAYAHDKMQMLNEAYRILFEENGFASYQEQLKHVFSAELRSLPGNLKHRVHELLEEGSYVHVSKLMIIIPELHKLQSLDERRLLQEVCQAIASEVRRLKADIPILWQKQDFPSLQRVMRRMGQMAECLGAYPELNLEGWSSEVDRKIAERLDEDVMQARLYLNGTDTSQH